MTPEKRGLFWFWLKAGIRVSFHLLPASSGNAALPPEAPRVLCLRSLSAFQPGCVDLHYFLSRLLDPQPPATSSNSRPSLPCACVVCACVGVCMEVEIYLNETILHKLFTCFFPPLLFCQRPLSKSTCYRTKLGSTRPSTAKPTSCPWVAVRGRAVFTAGSKQGVEGSLTPQRLSERGF